MSEKVKISVELAKNVAVIASLPSENKVTRIGKLWHCVKEEYYADGFYHHWDEDEVVTCIEAIIHGYDLINRKGTVALAGSEKAPYGQLHVKYSNGNWTTVPSCYEKQPVIYESDYKDAPAWVKACKWVPIGNESEVDD